MSQYEEVNTIKQFSGIVDMKATLKTHPMDETLEVTDIMEDSMRVL